MSNEWRIIGESGLQFFGTASASISHEIKNVLAIINENAGLLEDLTLMADKGMPLDPERLKKIAGKVLGQIRRADKIIKSMNRLAHSVDEPIKNVDSVEILELIAALSVRFAAKLGVTLKVMPSEGPVNITTNPFFLENLIWLCLDFAIHAAGPGKTVELITENAKKGVRITFARLEGLAETQRLEFPSEQGNALLNALNAEIGQNAGNGEIILMLPAKTE
ncbi:MAG: histidine kinase [Deltaproteobacteria bacterium]|nr:histidine kinase [Deltaproteobacteria bacterium]